MDARILRELELDGVARLFPPAAPAPATAPRAAPVAAPQVAASKAPAARSALACTADGARACTVVADRNAFEGRAGKLLDAMLGAIGLRRVDPADAQAARPTLALVFGEHDAPEALPAVAIPDPLRLLEHPAEKALAWESLLAARRGLAAP